MKYFLGIGCFILTFMCYFNCFKADDYNRLIATIFILLANIFFNMKRDD